MFIFNLFVGMLSVPPIRADVLDLPEPARRTLVARLDVAERGVERTIAWVPMTWRELAHLARTGVGRPDEACAVFLEREAALDDEAWARRVAELVVERADPGVPLAAVELRALRTVLAEARPMHPQLRDGAFSLDFPRLTRAAAEVADLPFEGPFPCELETSPFLEEMFNCGPDYGRLVARQRLRALAESLGVFWDDIDQVHSHARFELTQLFRNLPGHAGLVVGLGAKAFARIVRTRHATLEIRAINLSDVSEVEGRGDAERLALHELRR